MSDIVQKLWGFCHTLRHDGIDYGDYIEQITYLLFLKMADERALTLPQNCGWQTLRERSGTDLTESYCQKLWMVERKRRRTLGESITIFSQLAHEAKGVRHHGVFYE
jgi:type I restriction enzyme M protein